MPYTPTVYLTELSIICLSVCLSVCLPTPSSRLVSPRLVSPHTPRTRRRRRGEASTSTSTPTPRYAYVPGGANCCASIPRLDQPGPAQDGQTLELLNAARACPCNRASIITRPSSSLVLQDVAFVLLFLHFTRSSSPARRSSGPPLSSSSSSSSRPSFIPLHRGHRHGHSRSQSLSL